MLRATLTLVVALALCGASSAASTRSAGDPQLAAAQHALRTRGVYLGPIDGVAGPATVDALRRFQLTAGLAVDGVLGPQTRKALGIVPLGSRLLGFGATGADVLQLQFLLAWHGFPNADLGGEFNQHVVRAMVRFQRWAHLPEDGLAGASTLAALRRAPPLSPLRLAWPLPGAPTDLFGPRGTRFHSGIDIPAATAAPVAAARAGRVSWAADLGNWGLLVVVDHGSGVRSMYAHLSRIDVRVGQRVAAGAQVGLVGATGDATGPHLHFEVRWRGAAVDPLSALPER
jgi:peptidoglycan hydrolase-like protein with peptidoglycan-binding domain